MINVAICDGNNDRFMDIEKLFSNYITRSSVEDVVVFRYLSTETFINEYNGLSRINILFIGDENLSKNQYMKLYKTINNDNNHCQIIYLMDSVYYMPDNVYNLDDLTSQYRFDHIFGMAIYRYRMEHISKDKRGTDLIAV